MLSKFGLASWDTLRKSPCFSVEPNTFQTESIALQPLHFHQHVTPYRLCLCIFCCHHRSYCYVYTVTSHQFFWPVYRLSVPDEQFWKKFFITKTKKPGSSLSSTTRYEGMKNFSTNVYNQDLYVISLVILTGKDKLNH